MQIVKRDGETVEFNISKIVEAISKVLMDFAEKVEELTRESYAQIHEVAHAIMHFFGSLFGRSPKKKSLISVVYAVPLLVPDLKHITIDFLEHAREVRKQYLLTRYHRGNTDDTDTSFSCNLITVF